MPAVVPHRFLFRYSIPVRRLPRLPRRGRKLLNLPKECTLPDFGRLDEVEPFGALRLAWNERGVGISVAVRGKRQPVDLRSEDPAESDGLQVWIDTRNTQSVHRATRFCHHFCVLPGSSPAASSRRAAEPAMAVQLPIARAREDAPIAGSESLPTSFEPLKDGYRLELWLPAEALNGYAPDDSPRLGFYYVLRDGELGEQYLSVGREFPFAHDPSLWCTLELARE